jgi:hypothetical protein
VNPGDIIRAVHARRGTITAKVTRQTITGITAVILTGRWEYLTADDDEPGDTVRITNLNNLCDVSLIRSPT